MRAAVIQFMSAALMIAAAHAASQMHTGSHPDSSAPHSSADLWANGPAFSRALHEAMTRMHVDMVQAPPTGDPDRDFLIMMIPHHAGAVEMARLALISGQDPLVRSLAEEIIASQQAEIAAMKARLAILEKGADPKPGNFPALGGTRGR
jgi:uncharacterized protein (DUF305 family)